MRNSRLLARIPGLTQSAAVVFVVALTARMWAASQLLPDKISKYFYQYNEPARIAWALVSGHGYSSPWPNTPLLPTAQQPPFYPLLLAGIFKLFGALSYRSLCVAVALNALISAVTAVMILKIGKRAFGTATGVLAAWVWSCWVYEAVVSIRVWESSLSALLLISALWLLPELSASSRALSWLLFGLLAGVASLTNSTMLAVFPFFWLCAWLTSRRRGKSLGRLLAASVAVFILTLVPWTLRNYATFHRLMPLRDNFGLELWVGNYDGVLASHRYPPDFPILDPTDYNRLGELRFMESRREMALEFIRTHPGDYLRLSFARVAKFWTEPNGSIWCSVSLLAWIGLLVALRKKTVEAMPYAVVLVTFPLVYYLTHTFDTYRHPIEPEILLLASFAVGRASESVSRILLGTRSAA